MFYVFFSYQRATQYMKTLYVLCYLQTTLSPLRLFLT